MPLSPPTCNHAQQRPPLLPIRLSAGHLHTAQEGLAEVQADKVEKLPPDTIERVRKELFEIRDGILKLMDEFRGRSAG